MNNNPPAIDLDLANFHEPALDTASISRLLAVDLVRQRARALRLHDYYANPEIDDPASASTGVTSSPSLAKSQYAQEQGLPERIVGSAVHARKEVVVENDVGWRIDAGVDLLFGTNPTMQSLCPDPVKAGVIERLLASILEANGGLTFLHRLALVGSIYGSANVVLRPGTVPASTPTLPLPARGVMDLAVTPVQPAVSTSADSPKDAPQTRPLSSELQAAGRQMQLEIVHPGAGLPVFDPEGPQRLIAFVQHAALEEQGSGALESTGSAAGRQGNSVAPGNASPVTLTEILGHTWWQRYRNGTLLAQGPNPLGRIPLVHIQNLAQPFSWEGTSDVEPLISLQNELNTRLSDRAHRVTMTSFKMYLGKRIPDFVERKVGPGQMWATDDDQASIEAFGGDADCPNEREHIQDVREALDKISGINPLAAGVVRDKLGNLTSAVALRVTLLGAVARTSRKRLVYGRGIQQIVELVLAWLDVQGLFQTTSEERQIELHWPPVLPDDLERELALAQERLKVGVPQQTVLRELGYDPAVFGDPQS